jgi:hypothetical protein
MVKQRKKRAEPLEINYKLYKYNFGELVGLSDLIQKRGLDTKETPDILLNRCLACDNKWSSDHHENTCPSCGLTEGVKDVQMISRIRANAKTATKMVRQEDKRTGRTVHKRVEYLRAIGHSTGV